MGPYTAQRPAAWISAALLLLSCCVGHSAGQSLAEFDMVDKAHRTVCVRPYTGLDVCGPDGTNDFTGYEPEVSTNACMHSGNPCMPV